MNEPGLVAARDLRTGDGLAFIAAVAFSLKAILAKLAMAAGVATLPLLVLRMWMAAPFFALVLWLDRERPISARDAGWLVLLGAVGFHFAMWFDFSGLRYITAGLERIVLYAHPTMITLLAWMFLARPVRARQLGSVAICWLGLALAVGADLQLGAPMDVLRGVGLVLASALAYAIYLLGTEALAPRIGARRVGAAAALTSAFTLTAQAAATGELAQVWTVSSEVLTIVVVLVALSTVLPILLLAEAISRVGPERASTIGMIGPFSAGLLGWAVLGEPLTPLQIVGGLVVVAGIAFGRRS